METELTGHFRLVWWNVHILECSVSNTESEMGKPKHSETMANKEKCKNQFVEFHHLSVVKQKDERCQVLFGFNTVFSFETELKTTSPKTTIWHSWGLLGMICFYIIIYYLCFCLMSFDVYFLFLGIGLSVCLSESES